MEPNPIDQLRDALERWKEQEQEERDRNAIYNHYGVKFEEFNKIVGEIIADILTQNKKTDVLDKHFSKFSAEDRLRVEAYLLAREVMKKFK